SCTFLWEVRGLSSFLNFTVQRNPILIAFAAAKTWISAYFASNSCHKGCSTMDTLVLFALCLLSCHMPGYRPLYLFCQIALGPSPVQTTPFARVLSPCWNNGL